MPHFLVHIVMTFAAGFIVNGTYVWREPPESESHPDRPETLGEREASGRIQAKSLEVATFLEVYRFSAHLLQLSERWDTVPNASSSRLLGLQS